MHLRKQLLCLLAFFVLDTTSYAQTSTDANEGSNLTKDQNTGLYAFSWWGKSGRTYFIQQSDDLVHWTYVRAIEIGTDDVITWGFSSTQSRFFLRLKYVDIPTDNPFTADFDGDGVSNWDELMQQTDPLLSVIDDNGLPQDWEIHYFFGQLHIDANADPDKDGLTNAQEFQFKTNPQLWDTSGDGLSDGFKFTYGFDPFADIGTQDQDGDGLDDFSDLMVNYDVSNPYLSKPAATPGDAIEANVTEPVGNNPTMQPVDPDDSDNDGLSNEDDPNPNDPLGLSTSIVGQPSGTNVPAVQLSVDFYGTSNAQFEAWRTLLHKTINGFTYIYQISGQVNYQNTSAGHFKDYAYILDQNNMREDGLHWQGANPTFIDLDNGQPSADHSYFLFQAGDGGQQGVRPQDVKSGDLWSPGGGGPDGVADSYQDNTGSLTVNVIIPQINVVQIDSHDDRWPGTEPDWQDSDASAKTSTGDGVRFEVDLGAQRLNDQITSAEWKYEVQEGPSQGTSNGDAVQGLPRRGEFTNLSRPGRLRITATVHLKTGQQFPVIRYLPIARRTQCVTIVHWVDGSSILPAIGISECVTWAATRVAPQLGLSPISFIIDMYSSPSLEQRGRTDHDYKVALTGWGLKQAPDQEPLQGRSFGTRHAIDDFFDGSETGDSQFRLGFAFRRSYVPVKSGQNWLMKDDDYNPQPGPQRTLAGKTQAPYVSSQLSAKVQRNVLAAEIVMKPETHPTNHGALKRNTSHGNERIRFSGVARVGLAGQAINNLIFGQQVPWIYSNATFDASEQDGTTVEAPVFSSFSRPYVYVDGELPTKNPQMDVGDFLNTANNPLPSIDP